MGFTAPITKWKQSVASTSLFSSLRQWRDKLRRRRLERSMIRFYRQFIYPQSLCFDIGANVGDRTRIFRRLGAMVIAVEPQTLCLDVLRRRFGADPGVTIVPYGVSNRCGVAVLTVSDKSSTVASLSPEFRSKWRFAEEVRWNHEEEIQLTTLDELIKRFGRPAFCKVDVEGFEENVLKGLSRPVAALSFEFNIELAAEAEKCVTRLQQLGYTEFNYSIAESMEMVFPACQSGEIILRAIRTSSDTLLWGDIYAFSSVPDLKERGSAQA